MKYFAECTNCRVWSKPPKGFQETKHFIRCPKCNNPMYFIRYSDPKDRGMLYMYLILQEQEKLNEIKDLERMIR